MESALYGVYTLVVLYQKSHSFASLNQKLQTISMKYILTPVRTANASRRTLVPTA